MLILFVLLSGGPFLEKTMDGASGCPAATRGLVFCLSDNLITESDMLGEFLSGEIQVPGNGVIVLDGFRGSFRVDPSFIEGFSPTKRYRMVIAGTGQLNALFGMDLVPEGQPFTLPFGPIVPIGTKIQSIIISWEIYEVN